MIFVFLKSIPERNPYYNFTISDTRYKQAKQTQNQGNLIWNPLSDCLFEIRINIKSWRARERIRARARERQFWFSCR